jgi:uncharacterized protein
MLRAVLQTLTASDFRRAIERSLERLRASRAVIDAANVYPVPDSDTGTNLVSTFEGIVAALDGVADQDVPRAIRTAALKSARGNSGVIVAQILRALADDLDRGPVDGPGLAAGLTRAADLAYEAVMHPVEGTILSVMRAASRAPRDLTDASDVLSDAARGAVDALGHTPEQLPELQRAGVVDAGGMGLVTILNAFAEAVGGRASLSPAFSDAVTAHALRRAVREQGSTTYALEVQYLIETSADAIARLRTQLDAIGDSLAVTGGGGTWRVHVHTNDADAAVRYGAAAGALTDIEIVRFEDQIASQRDATADAAHVIDRSLRSDAATLIAVVAGVGMAKLFAELGAHVIDGGDRVEAGEATLIEAIASAPTEHVILLPNNEDVFARALDLDVEGKKIEVLRTTDQAAGLAAAVGFGDGRAAVDSIADMKETLARVRTGAVVGIPPGVDLRIGPRGASVAGYAEGEIVAAGFDRVEVAVEVAVALAADRSADVVTVLTGADASPAEDERLHKTLEVALPDAQVDVVHGGQPQHHYLVAVE